MDLLSLFRHKKKPARNQHGESPTSLDAEKRRARRRLIGAVALVLAVVIILPMILDSPPQPSTDDIEIQIPDKDQTSRYKEKQALEKASPATDAESEVTPKEQKNHEALPEKKNESKPAKQSLHQIEPSKSTSTESIAKQSDEAARALAILEGKAIADASRPVDKPKAGDQFIIQVAALTTQDKVAEVRHTLSKAGIQSYTQTVATPSGNRTRVRVGPFASHDEAEKIRIKINRLGLQEATIVLSAH